MFKLAIFFTLVAICVAHPGLLGLGGHGGLGLGIAAPAIVAAPLAVSSGISHQSRVDIRTPVVAVAAAPVAVASGPIAVGHGLGFGGVALGGLGLGHGALGLGHGALGLGLGLGHGK